MLKYIAAALLASLCVTPAFASIDQAINETVKPVAALASSIIFVPARFSLGQDHYEVPFIIFWLLAIGVFTTIYFRFINFTLFKLSLELLAGKHQPQMKCDGQISNWQALATSLSGTVGLGNIAGVAVAVSVGGPGATVWMILMGFLGMTTKFAECALGVKYRVVGDDGECSGGPMYYIKDGFAARGLPLLGKALALFFAVCCIGGALGGGNMFQANQAFGMYLRVAGEESFFADKGWFFGVILAILTGAVILGGIRSIAKASEAIFPAMTALYILACLYIIIMNMSALPDAVASIFAGMFSSNAAGGGILGALIAGVRRAVFSNEAGCGSAPITYAAVECKSHVMQGIIAMLNPFIDTVIICTMTALVIAVTGVYTGGAGMEGITLTARAFATAGDWTIYWLGVTVFLFAFSTLISWYYLGEKAFTYIFGRSKGKVIGFKVVYCLFVVVGCASNLSAVIDFTDALFFAMAIPNVIALYMMAPEIKKDLHSYLAELKAQKQA